MRHHRSFYQRHRDPILGLFLGASGAALLVIFLWAATVNDCRFPRLAKGNPWCELVR